MFGSDDPTLNGMLEVSNDDHDRLMLRMDQARTRMRAQMMIDEEIARRQREAALQGAGGDDSGDDADTHRQPHTQQPQPPVTPNPPNHPAPPELPEDSTDLIRARLDAMSRT